MTKKVQFNNFTIPNFTNMNDRHKMENERMENDQNNRKSNHHFHPIATIFSLFSSSDFLRNKRQGEREISHLKLAKHKPKTYSFTN
jgi:hypothetical protein